MLNGMQCLEHPFKTKVLTIVDARGDEDANGGAQLEHDVEGTTAGGVGRL